MADRDGDKTEAPTPRRRQEAREQGSVARSADLSSAALLVGGVVLLRMCGGPVAAALAQMTREMLSPRSLGNLDPAGGDVGLLALRAVGAVGLAVLPLLLGSAAIVAGANVAQVGLVFNPARLALRGSALNPLKGLGRLLGGGRGLAKFGISLAKLAIVGGVAYWAVAARLLQVAVAQQADFAQLFAVGADVLYSIALRLGAVLLVLAVADYLWQRYQFEKGLRMTKQEVKDEMRNMEGDPHVKQRRRQLAVAALRERLKVDVPKADVVVTNPTEFAIALRYDPDAMAAPRVVAKGQGAIAARIREIAIEHGVPILERKPLARALYKLCDVGAEVPEQFFSAVAEILAYVYELNGRFRAKHAA